MSRTSGLYKDFPQIFNGTLNYHVDESLSAGGFVGIWVIYYFLGLCVTVVLAIVVKRAQKDKPLGPGVQIIIFNLSSDIFTQLVHILFLSFTGGDLAVFSVGGLAVAAWFTQVSGFMQINSVIAMFHLRRKVMQDVEKLISDKVYNAKKYILVGSGVAIFSQLITIGGMTPNWLFNQKWYVNGPVESDAKRVMITVGISAAGFDNIIYNILAGINVALALPIPLLYCFYCLVPVLRLLRKLRKKGICSAEMQSLARLSITFYLIFVVFFMSAILIGILQSALENPNQRGQGLTWVTSASFGVLNTTANAVACYVFFPRFRAYGLALWYDIFGKSDRARKAEDLVEKQLEDYDRTIMPEGPPTTDDVDQEGVTATTEMASV